jgi:hypothetical protein
MGVSGRGRVRVRVLPLSREELMLVHTDQEDGVSSESCLVTVVKVQISGTARNKLRFAGRPVRRLVIILTELSQLLRCETGRVI